MREDETIDARGTASLDGERTVLLVVGAGGLGREVYHAALERSHARGDVEVGGFLDDRPDALLGSQLAHVPVRGPLTDYEPAPGERLVMAIGDAAGRLSIASALATRGARFHTLITPTARVTTRLDRLGEGCFVDHYALISTDVSIGPHSHVGAHATIGHDVTIGAGCHVGAFCFVGGEARIGAGVVLRSHATISPGVVIEDGAVVGPNTLVLRRVGTGETVLGVPGRRVVV